MASRFVPGSRCTVRSGAMSGNDRNASGCWPTARSYGQRSGGRAEVLLDQGGGLLTLADADLFGLLLPAEHAGGDDAVEPDRGERGEDLVEVDLAAAHLGVLVHADGRARRVDDVAQPARRGVVEGVGQVHVGELLAGGGDDA